PGRHLPSFPTRRSSDLGARELVRMASDLYASLPESERLEPDLLWANPALTREVYAHAWASTLGSERGNPVNVVFADYIGDPSSLDRKSTRLNSSHVKIS